MSALLGRLRARTVARADGGRTALGSGGRAQQRHGMRPEVLLIFLTGGVEGGARRRERKREEEDGGEEKERAARGPAR
ncbi:MAG: hypothetical protein CK538_07580 [Opitutia bacterium]|nr:MAG: hypothetical protein CK538_07580 [Opitutae bacterium]